MGNGQVGLVANMVFRQFYQRLLRNTRLKWDTRPTEGHTDNAIGLTAAEKKSSKTGDTHTHTNFQSKGNNLVPRTSIIFSVPNQRDFWGVILTFHCNIEGH